MERIEYIDRQTGEICEEKVYGDGALRFLYGSNPIGRLCRTIVSQSDLFSRFYGLLMKSSLSKGKIQPFIENFHIDTDDFLDASSTFQSFNDFFIRKLNPSSRPIDSSGNSIIIPADGRYLFYNTIDQFTVKGKVFDVDSFLTDPQLAERYRDGSMVVARLCPTDYHRFHFPCDCTPSKTQLINGYLYSVNPLAIQQNLAIFWENKRVITELTTEQYGKVLFVEIGATSVGSIHQTYTPDNNCLKGEEKGYFSFGGSSIIMLFEKGRVKFCEDLLAATSRGLEIKCLMGQKLS
jgi:phosphatidylserine decarboxylase